ncbi:MAG: AbrB/MazE/SpoVT family DNA-binding domain-containing protein [Candidatus Woesearchaeota archaeon]
MMEIVTVSTKGQVVIPENFRKNLQIFPGSRLVFREKQGKILIEPERSFLDHMDDLEEQKGWDVLALKDFMKIWDNDEDERWNKFA